MEVIEAALDRNRKLNEPGTPRSSAMWLNGKKTEFYYS